MLWIRDILVLIRIRGSVQLTYGSGSGSCSFRHWLSRANKKLVLLSRGPQPKLGFVVAYYFQNVFFKTIFLNKQSMRMYETIKELIY